MISYFRIFLNTIIGILSFIVLITLFVEVIITKEVSLFQIFYNTHYYIFLFFFLDSIINLILFKRKKDSKIQLVLAIISLLPILNHYGINLILSDISILVQQLMLFFIALFKIKYISFLFQPLRSNPAQSFIGGFVLFIFIGAIFIFSPISRVNPIPFIDALFISTSAICVTGLSVIDIGNDLTLIGKIILMLLIQIGGLGIMTFYALVTISLKQRFLSKESKEFQENWSTESARETFGLIKLIFIITIIVEGVGAALIFPMIPTDIGDIWHKLFYALFHSVSAFCNAGFSLFSNSLALFSNSISMVIVFSLLIIIGGIGFPVIFELYHYGITKKKHRMKLQTKIVLVVSGSLILIGSLVLTLQQFFEQDFSTTIIMSFFHSISARTAGFTMVDLNTYHFSSLWFILILMFIGASPGSTGGGIKTTTFGLLVSALISSIRSQEKIHLFGRYIKHQIIFKALSIFTMSFFIVFLAFFILLMTENISFFPLLFETVSAFATVGYSLGVTADLSNTGKVIMIFLMFFGRIGPLALAFALTRQPKVANYKFPEERVLLG